MCVVREAVLVFAEPAEQEAAETDQEQGGCQCVKTEEKRSMINQS